MFWTEKNIDFAPTCRDKSCNDPALSVLDGFAAIFHESLENGQTSGPLKRFISVSVISVGSIQQNARASVSWTHL